MVRGVVGGTLDFNWCDRGSNPCRGNDIVICSNYCTKCKIPGMIFSLLLGSTLPYQVMNRSIKKFKKQTQVVGRLYNDATINESQDIPTRARRTRKLRCISCKENMEQELHEMYKHVQTITKDSDKSSFLSL